MSGPYQPDRRQLLAAACGAAVTPAAAQPPAPAKKYPFKKSINQWAFPYPERMNLEACLRLAKAAGFDGIELNYDLDNDLSPKHGPAEFAQVRRLAEKVGISISGVCSFLFWPYPLSSNDPAKRARGLELAGKIAECAHHLGTENVLVVPGAVHIPWRTDHEPVPNDVCDRRAKEAVRALLPAAEKLRVFLHTRGWKSPLPCETRVDFVPKHESLASTVKEMVDGGANLHAIATTLGESYYTVRSALIFARCGERPKSNPPGQRTGTRTGPPQYVALASEVARLRDVERVPFNDIAVRLNICDATARRAYDHAHRNRVRAAVEGGQPYTRGRFVRIDHAVRCEIRERWARGEAAEFIASVVGCSASTVRLIAREE